MTIIFLVILIFTFITCRYTKENTKYLDKDYTNMIKGIFLLLVFIRHFVQYKLPFNNSWIDSIGLNIDSRLGQLIVTLFLFYSGYGIIESFKKKKDLYLNNFVKNRILTTIINFNIAVIIYAVCYYLFISPNITLKKFILALIGWDSLGNSNWYIFCIVILYFITYLSLKSFKVKKEYLLSITIGTLLYMIIMSFYKQAYYYNTAMCFVLGAIFSAYKENIETWLKNKEMICFIYTSIIFVISYKLQSNIIWNVTNTLSFTIIILLLTRKININNKVLKWFGQNLFPLYIFQRLPMILLNKVDFFHNQPYLFFIVAFIITILIAYLYNFILSSIKKRKQIIKNNNI